MKNAQEISKIKKAMESFGNSVSIRIDVEERYLADLSRTYFAETKNEAIRIASSEIGNDACTVTMTDVSDCPEGIKITKFGKPFYTKSPIA